MGIVRCENGHYYSDDSYQSCPHCEKDSEFQKHHAYAEIDAHIEAEKIAFAKVRQESSAVVSSENAEQDNDVTIGIYQDHGVNPVAAWLVQRSGMQRGMDYRIVSGRNAIHQLCGFHETAYVVYDAKSSCYWLQINGDYADFRLNGKPLSNNIVSISDRDVIAYRSIEFLLVALCKEEYLW